MQSLIAIDMSGADFADCPDYAAEIHAAAGTTSGVSAYQFNLGRGPIKTPAIRLTYLWTPGA